MAESFSAPVFELEATVRWREDLRSRGKTVVFTNGVFDLVHAGHVEYLAWARSQGDALVLGLNADASVRALKGAERPLVPFADRAAVVAGLRSVDAVVGFSERTPEVVLDRIRPDVHVKSAQYRSKIYPNASSFCSTVVRFASRRTSPDAARPISWPKSGVVSTRDALEP